MLDAPAYGLAVDGGAEVDLFPGERVRPVQLVRSLGVAGVAVNGYPDEVAGDWLAARVEQLAPLVGVVGVIVVGQPGIVVFDDQARGLRFGLHAWMMALARRPQTGLRGGGLLIPGCFC